MNVIKLLFLGILVIFSIQSCSDSGDNTNDLNQSKISDIEKRSLSVGEIHNLHLKNLQDNFSSNAAELQYTNNYFGQTTNNQAKISFYQNKLASLVSGVTNAWSNDNVKPYLGTLLQSTGYSTQLKALVGNLINASSNQLTENDLKNSASQLNQGDEIIALSLIDIYHRSFDYWTNYSIVNNVVINGPGGGGDVQGITFAAAIDMAAYMYVHSGTTWGDNWKERDNALALAGQVSQLVIWICCG